MTNANDSFIDEVTEAVRRDRLARWFRRWGWAVLAAALAVVALAGWIEWRQSQARAVAQLRGEAILSAIELRDGPARLAALSELPTAGPQGVVAALLLAAEQEGAGDAEAAAATLGAVAQDGGVPPLWRDLAALKAQMALGDAADPTALEALAAPGAPFRLLALEQWATLDLARGRTEEAVARLRELAEDAEVPPSQAQRVEALLTALGAGPDEAADAPAAARSAEPGAAAPPAIADPGRALRPDAEPRPPATDPDEASE